MNNGNIYHPLYTRPEQGRKPSPAEKLVEHKREFAVLNRWITTRGGWIVSIPGDLSVRIEVLEGSSVPEELREEGYVLTSLGESERILHTAVEQKFVRAPDGTFVPVTPGSSGPVALVTQQAGLVTVLRFGFNLS